MPQLDSGPMRPDARTTLVCVLLAAVAALAVAGCGSGGSETIPEDQAQELQSTVENVRDTYENDNCEDMQTYLSDLNDQVDSLDVTSDVKDGLRELTDRLGEQTSNCQQEETTSSSTSSSTTSSTIPTTTPSTTESSTTEETTTEETTTTETTTTEPPEVEPEPPGTGPGGTGPPGQDGSGGTAPREEKKAGHEKKPKKEKK